MQRISRLAAAAGVALATTMAGMPAHTALALDFDAAYCPYGTMSGNVSYLPGVTTTPAPNSFTMNVGVSCGQVPSGDESGNYTLTLNGTTPSDSCAGSVGVGSGTISGSGPEGAITGAFTFTKPAIHYYINGTYVSGGENHTIQLWMDLIPSTETPTPCLFYNFSQIIGHGAFVDSPPPLPQGGIAVLGTANLPVFPCSLGSLLAPGCTGATFVITSAVGLTSVTIDRYYEPCAGAVGSAAGRIVLTNGQTRYYSWMRVGTTATIQITDGSGNVTGGASGGFVPSATTANCLTGPTPLRATVEAAGATT